VKAVAKPNSVGRQPKCWITKLSTGVACDRGHDAVAATRDGHDVTLALPAIPQDLAQRQRMHPQARLLDDGVRPDTGDQVFAAHHLAGVLDQGHEHVECAAAQRHRPAALEQLPLRCVQPNGPNASADSATGAAMGSLRGRPRRPARPNDHPRRRECRVKGVNCRERAARVLQMSVAGTARRDDGASTPNHPGLPVPPGDQQAVARVSFHFRMASSAGQSACPQAVRRYSTLGGTSGWTVRSTMPSASSWRSCCASIF
jgi:hypothetical protein